MEALLQGCHVLPGFLDLAMGSCQLVKGIRDPETLSANVPVPKSACPPGVVVAGLVRGLDWGRCRC